MNGLPIAGFWRRIAAVVYDALILVSLLMLATALATLFSELIAPGLNTRQPDALRHHPAFHLWLLAWWFGYYSWSWRKGGQTVGMRAWRLRLLSQLGNRPSHWQIAIRLAIAAFAAALLLAAYKLLEAYGQQSGGRWLFGLLLLLQLPMAAIQDKFSHTDVRVLPKPEKT